MEDLRVGQTVPWLSVRTGTWGKTDIKKEKEGKEMRVKAEQLQEDNVESYVEKYYKALITQENECNVWVRKKVETVSNRTKRIMLEKCHTSVGDYTKG